MSNIRFFFIYCCFLIGSVSGYAQSLSDTMRIGNADYVRFVPHTPIKTYTARIVNDTMLVVFDSTGQQAGFKIESWTIATTEDGNYSDRKVTGSVIPLPLRILIAEQSTKEWLTIEQVVARDEAGRTVRFNGEKWVRQ